MALKKPPIDVLALRAQIASEHDAITSAADALTKRLLAFQSLISKVRGRVEATVYEELKDSPEMFLGLRLAREAKEWVLKYSVSQLEEEDPDISWMPISEASVKLKINLVGLFPRLLLSIVESQAELRKQLDGAVASVDELCRELEADVKSGAK